MIDTLSTLITWGIVFLFMYSFWESFSDPSKHLTIISYLTDFEEKTQPSSTKTKSAQRKKKDVEFNKESNKNKPSRQAEEKPNEQLKEDCNAAMKSLGVDYKQRQYLLKTIFHKFNPKTVEEFLRQAFV
jgi:hypothetical protein